MDLVRVETKSQVCIFLSMLWVQLGNMSVQDPLNLYLLQLV
jgi:hypothetical protein